MCNKKMEPVCPKCDAKIKKNTSKWNKFWSHISKETEDSHC